MNDILALPKSELLINLMWFRINMDMANEAVQHHVTELFGDEVWKEKEFLSQHGEEREEEFLRISAVAIGEIHTPIPDSV